MAVAIVRTNIAEGQPEVPRQYCHTIQQEGARQTYYLPRHFLQEYLKLLIEWPRMFSTVEYSLSPRYLSIALPLTYLGWLYDS